MGWVNHCPDKACGAPDSHRHFVWHRDGSLYRSRVAGVVYYDRFWSDEADAFFAGHVREVLSGNGRYFNGGLPHLEGYPACEAHFSSAGISTGAELSRELVPALSAWRSWLSGAEDAEKYPDLEHLRNRVTRAREDLSAELEKLAPAQSPAEVDALYAAHLAAVAAEAERRQRHQDVRAALAELPQLFIAV